MGLNFKDKYYVRPSNNSHENRNRYRNLVFEKKRNTDARSPHLYLHSIDVHDGADEIVLTAPSSPLPTQVAEG